MVVVEEKEENILLEAEETPVEREGCRKLEWPDMAALGTNVVTNTGLPTLSGKLIFTEEGTSTSNRHTVL